MICMAMLLASNEYQLVNSRNEREATLVNLKQLMNYQDSSELTVEVSALAQMIPAYEQNNVENVYEQAMQGLPEALIAAYDVRISKLNVYTTRASLYPSIGMNGGISFGYCSSQSKGDFWKQISDKNRIGKYIGINMSIPVFSGLSRRSNLSRAKNNYQSACIRQKQTGQSVFAEVQKAILDLDSQIQRFEAAQKKEKFSELAYNAGKKKYEQGLVTIIELNTTSSNLLQAKFDLLKARLNYVMQKRMVDFYKGVPLQNKIG